MKSFLINKQLYSDITEKLCRKIDIYRHKNKEELEIKRKDIERLENVLLERTTDLLTNKEFMKTSDKNLKDKFDAEINKYREKVKI